MLTWHMGIAAVLVLAEVSLVMMPVVRYVTVGWLAKRSDIMDGLGPDARLAYFEMFCRHITPPPLNTACKAFEDLYSQWYGRRFYLLPGLLLFVIAMYAAAAVTATVLGKLNYIANPFPMIPDPAIAALTGAYLWTVNDFISRARRLDFAPSDVLWGVLRFVVSIPMGYAFAAVVTPGLAPFIAFALGTFPLATISTMLQRLANKTLNLEASAAQSFDDIIKLQGINPTIVERLNNEDITTVVQLAYCDPVRLTMRSNLRFNFITDCMNQALAWMYLESLLTILRPMGMRGACEIRELMTAYDNPGITADEMRNHALAVAAFPVLANATGIAPEALQETFRQIGEDPFSAYLMRIWT